ncbi:MAG: hypothetical protein OXT09_01255 [Myxococcales bacterium]|nr:hypothetical protein [Myxococcales bacterium]
MGIEWRWGGVCALMCVGCATAAEPVVLDSYGFQTPAMGIEAPGQAVVTVAGAPADMCASQTTPWQGPALCGPDAVLQPLRGRCSVYSDATPHLDPLVGHYRAERDRRNWVDPRSGGVLEVLQVYVVDNGEGERLPHGPHGNLYWDVFGPFEPVMESRDGAAKRRLGRARVLRGPHRTHGRTDEWLDDEAMMYSGAGLYRWGSVPGTERGIVLRIWESDGTEDGFLGRRNDVLGMEYVDRAATERPCGVWVPFHRYRNSHPRRRTSHVAVWMLLRTSSAPGTARWARNTGSGRDEAPDLRP